ncbi:MAG: L,D-transpeptidase/peptidoglycan binding protein [Coriobacteriales bacterium]|jgi:flagellar basal body-associated protein FliL|nr:L,D-transpeptidase/peptidoglycan binding protein [Coriobacteriales bacterium]
MAAGKHAKKKKALSQKQELTTETGTQSSESAVGATPLVGAVADEAAVTSFVDDSVLPSSSSLPRFELPVIGVPPQPDESEFLIKKKKSHKALWVTLISIFVVLVGLYVGASVYFMSHFGFNTIINDVDYSFKTVSDVNVGIQAGIDEYQLEVVGRKNAKEFITSSSVGLAYKPDGKVEELLEAQEPFLWIKRVFSQPAAQTVLPNTLDRTKLKSAVDKLKLMNPDAAEEPVDAYLEFVDAAYVVHPDEPGTAVIPETVYEVISDALLAAAPTVDLHEKDAYVKPSIDAENQELLDKMNRYNTYARFSITYTFGADKTEVLGGETAIEWYDFDEDGNGTLNQDKLIAWVAAFAERHNTVGRERTFTTNYGTEATVSGGEYGWRLDQDAEIDAINTAITEHLSETRDPYFSRTAAVHEAADWGNTYVEVSIATQHMYYVKDGEILLESDVVTGAPYGGRATPTGVWWISEKSSPAVLRGPATTVYPPAPVDDPATPDVDESQGPTPAPYTKYEWESPVTYWMRVTDSGVGLHDATWQPWFGGDRYTYGGSHGCINMPYGKAQELYGMLEMGTPVIVHN